MRLIKMMCRRCHAQVVSRRWVARELAELFGDTVQQPQLAALVRHLLTHRDPNYVARWLRHLAPAIVKYLMRAVAGHELDAEHIFTMRDLPGGTFLLESVRQSGCMPLPSLSARFNRFVAELVAATTPSVRMVIEAYAAHYDREYLRLRRDQRPRSWNLHLGDRRSVRVATQLVQWCTASFESLEQLTPGELERYLRDKPDIDHRYIAQFVTWLADTGRLRFRPRPCKRRYRPSPRLAEAIFVDTLQRALHDETLPLRVKVMLLFVILACRMPAEVCSLEGHVVSVCGPDRVEVRFERGIPQLFEGQAARLITTLAESDPRWLFPSHAQTGHLTPGTMKVYFRRLGLPGPRVLHNSALWEKLKDQSAVEVANILGMSPIWVEDVRKRLHPVDPAHRAYVAQLAKC
jgi:hypothetical protein